MPLVVQRRFQVSIRIHSVLLQGVRPQIVSEGSQTRCGFRPCRPLDGTGRSLNPIGCILFHREIGVLLCRRQRIHGRDGPHEAFIQTHKAVHIRHHEHVVRRLVLLHSQLVRCKRSLAVDMRLQDTQQSGSTADVAQRLARHKACIHLLDLRGWALETGQHAHVGGPKTS